jgi:16S rRNA processing protein RimM
MVTVGRVVRPQGRRGEVVVESETDFAAQRFAPGARLWASKGGVVSEVDVVSSWPHQERWVLGFAGATSIDDAETWRGAELRVPVEALQPLGPGAFYVHDLVGCRVETLAGTLVGEVTRVDLEGTTLLAVKGNGREVLVPLAESICREVDIAAKVIRIDPPEGLLDL